MVAVALLGVLMLRGRLPVREGLQVVVGCFLLLGAPTVAAGLLQAVNREGTLQSSPPASEARYQVQAPAPPPPVDYDPYAGATVRQDQR